MDTTKLFGTEKISRILFRLAPPVMLAQLIQALYNIIDSLFVGRYSGSGLTALSIIYPIQLLMIALAAVLALSLVGCSSAPAASAARASAALEIPHIFTLTPITRPSRAAPRASPRATASA